MTLFRRALSKQIAAKSLGPRVHPPVEDRFMRSAPNEPAARIAPAAPPAEAFDEPADVLLLKPALSNDSAEVFSEADAPWALEAPNAEEAEAEAEFEDPEIMLPDPEPVANPDPIPETTLDPLPVEEGEPETPAAPARSRRARTRLLGFNVGAHDILDPFADPGPAGDHTPLPQTHPTGWLVVVQGPGRGHYFPLFNGVAMIGRGEDQTVRLDFGDMAISRQSHAAIAFDAEQNKFFVGHGGKSNIIRLNDQPVLSTEEMKNGDCLRVGVTSIRLVALCGDAFHWSETSDE